MAYFAGVNLSERGLDILKELFFYRGMTGKQLVIFITKTSSYTLSEEKSVYNYLRTLKNNGLVESFRLQDTISRGSIFYLSKKGLELIKDILNIDEGQSGSGILPHNEKTTFWDIPYDYQTPPLKQPAHHLMQTQFMANLFADQEHIVSHRINLYAAKIYMYKGKKYRFRPDAELFLPTGTFCVEMDRATESHDQLIQKFETYKRYLEYCKENEIKTYINTILFVVEGKKRDHGIRRRWNNILSAFLKGMKDDYPKIRLVLTTLDDMNKTINIENSRERIEDKVSDLIDEMQFEKGYYRAGGKVLNIGNTQQFISAHFIHEEKRTYKIVFFAAVHEFESGIYTKYRVFESNVLTKKGDSTYFEGIEGKAFEGVEKYVFCYDTPQLDHKFDYYEVDKTIVSKFIKLNEDLIVHRLN